MELLGIPPGQAGRAKRWRFLLDARLDEGPLGKDEARRRLLEMVVGSKLTPVRSLACGRRTMSVDGTDSITVVQWLLW